MRRASLSAAPSSPGEAAIVEADEAADPIQAAEFGAEGVVFAAQDEAALVEDSWPQGVHGAPLVVDGEEQA